MPKLNMVQAINLALHQEMERDSSVIQLGQDIGLNGGVFRVTEGLQKKFGEERVIDSPLAESAIAGASIGMALAGLRPVAEMQFSGFSYYALQQMESYAARWRSRSQGEFTVPMVLRMPYGGGVHALEHHSESREATYAHFPGLKVVLPSGPRNARALLAAAIQDNDPVVFMEPKRSYRAFREEVPEEPETMEIGKAQIVQEGRDITLIAWGAMMREALAATKTLEERGKSVELIDLLSVSPLDSDTISDSVRKTGRCVIVQEAPRTLGVSSEIIARINDAALLYLEAPVGRVTGYDVVTPNFAREKYYLPNAGQVVDQVESTLAF
ncbi:MAG: alpha-ketoacid dehydrogenase subunit beta [Candidatus Krumholzibacteria bacterium]|nr:alpha-ketoacid dehydrogenase subunit beta [Candidatus Krumholzibacteria bacterium]MDP6796734.1 alpha-ketoacid dehydrogenase subunit beta [Candidatus Krumholzibacteria bacterium]MDP7022365.1 alpha-ketoacid dehydrogenase subunit beta [Candidatus Krumholzibacteria bacterium]